MADRKERMAYNDMINAAIEQLIDVESDMVCDGNGGDYQARHVRAALDHLAAAGMRKPGPLGLNHEKE